jgi:Carboxypeptidase regulatory-like domain/TonB-dependent Receptor Plug Domain
MRATGIFPSRFFSSLLDRLLQEECRRTTPLGFAIILTLGMVICYPRSMRAQTTGAITGVVTDPSGAVVPNATVTITNMGTGVAMRTLKTNDSGTYDAEALPVATYQVSVKAPGFQEAVRSDIELNVASRLGINFTLQLGAATQKVEVTGAAPLVQTQSGAQSHTVGERQMTQLPILDRNFMELQALVPGTIKTGADEIGKGFYGERGFAVNGMNEHYTGYQLDGVQNTDMGNQASTLTNPGPDNLREFRVLTSNYSAKYGTAGGAVLLAVTKSGTRDFHGDVYEFLRNDALNANNFFLNRNNQPTPPLRYNDYGYTFGGPFYIPDHYNSDRQKTFFFWSQEWIKQRAQSAIVAATPTQDMRDGNFTGFSLTNPTSPQTGQPLTDSSGAPCVTGGNQINPNCMNSNVQLLLQQDFPPPNASGFNNFVKAAPQSQDWREDMIRVDQNVSDKVKVFVRFIHDSWIEQDPTTQWSGDAFPTLHSRFNIPSRNLIAKVTTILSPTLLNEISYNYASNYPASSSNAMEILGATQLPTGYTAQTVFNENYQNLVPDLSFSGGYGGISSLWGNWWAHHNISQASDDLSKQLGAHSLEAGVTGQFSITPVQSQTSPSSQGSYSFDGRFTGNPIADLILGMPASYSELQGRREPYYNYHQVEAYFQDNWKLNRKLTLNLGVRWFGIPQVYSDAISGFRASLFDPAQAPTVLPDGTIVPNSGNLLNGIIVAGKNGIPRSLVQNHYNTWAPRFGFAWDPTGSGKTAIRGGYGLGYYRIEGNDVYRLVGNPPFSQLATFFNPPFDNPAAGVAAPLTPRSVTTLDPIFDVPTAQNWSLGFQRQLTSNLEVSVAYVGSRGTHLEVLPDLNQPLPVSGYDFSPLIACTPTTPYPCASRISTDAARPYQGFSSISSITPVGTSIYHSFQLSLQQRISHGLSFGAVYTYGKAIGLAGANSLSSTPQNSYNINLDRGTTPYDRTHVFTVNYVYDLPIFQGARGIAGGLFKGWEATGLVTLESGLAMTPGFTSSTQGLATRPDVVAGQTLSGPGTVDEFFNTTAFLPAPFGHFGDAGLGIIRGPSYDNFDLGFFKNTRVREHLQIQFRAEMFNAFNHTNLNGLDTSFGSGAFGQATSAHEARNVQLGLKFVF